MKTLLATTALILAFSSPAYAYDKGTVAYGLGYVEVFDDVNNAVQGNVEYRSADFSKDTIGVEGFSWMAGVEADTNTSGYVYTGLLYDLPLTDKISLTPSVGAGFYREGEGKDLGGSFEFRDTIEVNYKLDESSRIGLSLSHKSSAGVHDRNPGVETMQVVYSQNIQ